MIVGRALARWSQRTNRLRALELVARVLPWLAALAIAAVWFGSWPAIAVASAAGVAVIVLAARRATWHRPATIARSLDDAHHTADLLQTALALEAGVPEPLSGVIEARALDLVERISDKAVAPVKLRPSPLGALAAALAASLVLLLGAGGPAGARHELGAQERAQVDQIAGALDELAHDETLPADVRAQLEKAKQALRSARESASGTAALAAMSEAQRLLDELAPQMKNADDPRHLTDSELSDRLAQAVKNNDAAQIAATSTEAMRRANGSDAAAESMANAMKRSSLAAAGGDPWNSPQFPTTPEGQRLSQLAQAGQQLSQGERDASKQTLDSLAQQARTASTGAPKPGTRGSRLDSARQALASLRAMQRSALNGQTGQTARADAARAAGSGNGSGNGSGAGSGQAGLGSGAGSGQGMGQGAGMGTKPGQGAGSGAGNQGSTLSVLGSTPGGTPGASGTSGGRAGMPSGARPEQTSAEEVATQPPPLSPEGVVRAIAEQSNGVPGARHFGPVRDHYQAIAEAAIRRDEIPLTRRDFIQRYFEALRTHEAK